MKLENTISNESLGKIIWIPPQFRELSENTNEITQKVFAIWDFIHTQEKWEFNSPLIPLRETNFFPSGKGKWIVEWIKNERERIWGFKYM